MKCVKILEGHIYSVNSVVFSPNCNNVVTASSDETIRLWDIEFDKSVNKLVGHETIPDVVSYSSNGEYMVSISPDGTARLWDAKLGECKKITQLYT